MTTDTAHRLPLDPARITALGADHRLGALGEQLATDHLRDHDGLEVVVRNWRLATGPLRGELDVIARDVAADRLVVVEVKTRSDAGRFGGAVSAVSPAKQARIRALTAAFLRSQPVHTRHVRLDVIAIDLGASPRLTHLVGVL